MKKMIPEKYIKKLASVLLATVLAVSIMVIPQTETAQAASKKWITVSGGAPYEIPYLMINGYYGLRTMRKLNSDGRTAQYVALLNYKKGTIKYLTDYDMIGEGSANTWSEGWAIVGQSGASKYLGGIPGWSSHPRADNWTYINTSGKRINDTWYYGASTFKFGLAVVKYYGTSNEPYTAVIDTKGKELIRVDGDVKAFIRYGHFRLGDKYYDFNLNELDIDDAESIARDIPGFNLAERDAFMAAYASRYDKVKYAGSARFVVKKDGKEFLVDTENKVLSKKYASVYSFYLEKTMLFRFNKTGAGPEGVLNKDGKEILPAKYYFCQAVTGNSFSAVEGEKMYCTQYVFSSTGKVRKKETKADLAVCLKNGGFTELRSYNYDGQIPATEIAYFYGDPAAVSYTCSTKVLKDILKQCNSSPDFGSNKAAKYLFTQAKAMAKKSKGNSFQVLNMAASCSRMIIRKNLTPAPTLSGKYFITPMATQNMEWTVPGGNKNEGVDIQLYTANGKPEHMFTLLEYNDGTCSLQADRFLRSKDGVLELGWKENFCYKANFKVTKAKNGGYYIQDYNDMYLTYHSTENYAPLIFEKKSEDITSQTFKLSKKSVA